MRIVTCAAVLLVAASLAATQPPMGEERPGEAASDNPDLTDYMMSFNKKGDGKLSKEELTDRRLYRLFDRADTDKDGVVTREELQSLTKQLAAEYPAQTGGGGPPPFGGGPRGFGPPGGPPRPGEILPRFLQDRLQLSGDQKKQIEKLQKEVDTKLNEILSDEQKQQLKEMRQRGPGGFGPKDKDRDRPKKGPPSSDSGGRAEGDG